MAGETVPDRRGTVYIYSPEGMPLWHVWQSTSSGLACLMSFGSTSRRWHPEHSASCSRVWKNSGRKSFGTGVNIPSLLKTVISRTPATLRDSLLFIGGHKDLDEECIEFRLQLQSLECMAPAGRVHDGVLPLVHHDLKERDNGPVGRQDRARGSPGFRRWNDLSDRARERAAAVPHRPSGPRRRLPLGAVLP